MTRRIEVGLAECSPAEVQRLLHSLPSWFAIDSAVAEYVSAAAELPTYLAYDPCRHVVGALLVKRHFPVAAEVYLMAVHPAWHRKGIGRALLETVETQLSLDGVRLLQVKTLGPSHPDDGYGKTRAFYTAMGFLPVEEMTDLWPGTLCLLMAKSIAPG